MTDVNEFGSYDLLEVVPDATSLIESMRAVGYTVEAAIADLIDNSISAGATKVQVDYDAAVEFPFVAILDNGVGMTSCELTNAMRHGSADPNGTRRDNDLGRYGLGLKTASLSQCRRLTVVSKKLGELSTRCWDIDIVHDTGKWMVVVPDDKTVAKLPLVDQLAKQESGTVVIWQGLDRLLHDSANPQREMTVRMEPVEAHLALVFHRFVSGEPNHPPIKILINGAELPARDPFLSGNRFRQPLESQTIRHSRGIVDVQPYILPPIKSMTGEELDLAGARKGLRGTQGFYVYRGRRLVVWGTWFNMSVKDEFYKLSRVRVDIPNSFDDLWSLKIDKSGVIPPTDIRDRLRDLVPGFALKSRTTVTYEGRKRNQSNVVPVWDRIETERGNFTYLPNAEHPLIQLLFEKSDAATLPLLKSALKAIGVSLPLESIYADMSSDKRSLHRDEALQELVETARLYRELMSLDIDEILKLDPISQYPELHISIKENIENDRA